MHVPTPLALPPTAHQLDGVRQTFGQRQACFLSCCQSKSLCVAPSPALHRALPWQMEGGNPTSATRTGMWPRGAALQPRYPGRHWGGGSPLPQGWVSPLPVADWLPPAVLSKVSDTDGVGCKLLGDGMMMTCESSSVHRQIARRGYTAHTHQDGKTERPGSGAASTADGTVLSALCPPPHPGSLLQPGQQQQLFPACPRGLLCPSQHQHWGGGLASSGWPISLMASIHSCASRPPSPPPAVHASLTLLSHEVPARISLSPGQASPLPEGF